MANITGNSGRVLEGANVIAEVLDFSITEGVAIIDNSALDDAADTHLSGSTNWSGSINCYWDSSDTGQGNLSVGASVTIHLQPQGAGVGNSDFTGVCTIESIERSVARNSIVTANFSFTGNGVLTEATL